MLNSHDYLPFDNIKSFFMPKLQLLPPVSYCTDKCLTQTLTVAKQNSFECPFGKVITHQPTTFGLLEGTFSSVVNKKNQAKCHILPRLSSLRGKADKNSLELLRD